jgi:tetratricopeptide (TPR) repeat protein
MARRVCCLAVLAVLAVSPSLAGASPWVLVQSRNFTLVGDSGEKSLHDVALRFEQFRSALARIFPKAQLTAPAPTVVVVFGSRKAYEPFKPRYRNKAVDVRGYFVQGQDVNYVTLTTDTADEDFRVVCHEYTHFVIGNQMSSVPAWLNEGLAEFYSTFALKGDAKGAFIGRVIPHHILALRERFIPLDELMGVDHKSPLYNEGDRRTIFYAESWALTHYLLIELADGATRINRYLSAIAGGEAADRAFAAAFGALPRDFEKQLRAYVGRRVYQSMEFTFTDRVEADRGAAGRALTEAESEAWKGDLLLHIDRVDEARSRLETALALDANVARAHLSFGMLSLRQENDAAAWMHLQRAVSLEPDNYAAQYAYGISILRYRDQQPDAADRPPVETARAALATAVRLQPDSTEALAWLGYADLLSGAHLDEARASLQRAVTLAPGRADYAFRLAEICARQQDYVEARHLLARLLTVHDEYGTADHAQSLLDAIDHRPASATRRSAAGRVIHTFREVREGEHREHATLERIQCGGGTVTLWLKIRNETVSVRARSLEAVEFISYRPELTGNIVCGLREPPDAVFVTWKEPLREVVAVEFLPNGYVPER